MEEVLGHRKPGEVGVAGGQGLCEAKGCGRSGAAEFMGGSWPGEVRGCIGSWTGRGQGLWEVLD